MGGSRESIVSEAAIPVRIQLGITRRNIIKVRHVIYSASDNKNHILHSLHGTGVSDH